MPRKQYGSFRRWLRLVMLGVELTRCVSCKTAEGAGPDLLCNMCYANPLIREAYADD